MKNTTLLVCLTLLTRQMLCIEMAEPYGKGRCPWMYLKAKAQWRCVSENSGFITPDVILKAVPALSGSAVRADL